MKKKIIAAFVGLTLGLGTVFGLSTSNKTTMDDMILSSVQIGHYCSGTVINDPDLSDGEQMTVISAKHCLAPSEDIGSILDVNVINQIGQEIIGEKTIKAVVKDVSEESDLILLQAIKKDEGLDLPKISIYKGTPMIGDHVFAVSYPFAFSKLVTEGYLGYVLKVSAFDSLSKSVLFRLTSAQVAGGSSGSAIYKETDEGYQLVGVLTGGMAFLSVYTPTTEILTFLDRNTRKNG